MNDSLCHYPSGPLPPVNIKTTDRQLTSLLIDWYDPGNETMFDWYYVAFERPNELGNFTEVGYLYPNMTSVFLEGLMPEHRVPNRCVYGRGRWKMLWTFSDGELFSAYTGRLMFVVIMINCLKHARNFTKPNDDCFGSSPNFRN